MFKYISGPKIKKKYIFEKKYIYKKIFKYN